MEKGQVMKKRKLAVIFQGIGYNADKPLLYYSKKIALEHDYEVISIGYEGIDTGCLKAKEKMLEAFGNAEKQVEEQLKDVDFSEIRIPG